MPDREKLGHFGRRAHLVTLGFSCLFQLLLSMPEEGRCAAIAVKENINLNGNEITVDSYNSSDPALSVNGQWAASVSGDGGDVICAGGITNSVSVGNADIYGHLYVGSGASVSLGADGAVGTHAWLYADNFGIELGYLVLNSNFLFPNVSLPDYSGFPTPSPGTVVITNSGSSNPVTNSYDAVLSDGNYAATGGLGNTIVTGPSILVLPNGYSIGSLTIAPGGSLTVYAGGTSLTLSGNTIVNQGGLPSSFVIYCGPSVTSLSISTAAQFVGVIIAPNVIGTINGGGENGVDISGAIIARSLTFNGHVSVHFDEALLQDGIIPPDPSFAASLMAPVVSGSGQFQFNVTGVPGVNYVVETSSNLTDWLPVFTNTSPFTFTDTNAIPAAQNFYRAVYYQ